MRNLIKKILKENDELGWMDSVSDQPLPYRDRATVPFSELFESKLRSMDNQQQKQSMINHLTSEGVLGYDEDEDEYTWYEEPWMGDWDNRDFVGWRFDTPEWEYVGEETVSYELEYSMSRELVIFRRKSDGRFFGYEYDNYYHDGPEETEDHLTERFKQRITKEIWA